MQRPPPKEWPNYLKAVGLQPIGDSYYQPFQFNAGAKHLTRTAIRSRSPARVGKPLSSQSNDDFRPLAFQRTRQVEGDVVFAGYGLAFRKAAAARYNSYDGFDVTDKIVLILRYVPEGVDAARRAQLNRYAGLRYKVMMARERGAKAVLVVTGPNSPQAGELLPLTGDGALAGSGVLAASISGAVADVLLAPAGQKAEGHCRPVSTRKIRTRKAASKCRK